MAAIKIDGTEYELPSMDELNMGELRIVYRYTGRTLDQLDGEGFDPDLISAIIHLAIRRVKPNLSFEEITERVDLIDQDTLKDAMTASEVADGESGNAPAPASVSKNGDGGEHSGDAGSNGSDTFPENATDASSGPLHSGIGAT